MLLMGGGFEVRIEWDKVTGHIRKDMKRRSSPRFSKLDPFASNTVSIHSIRLFFSSLRP